MSNSQPGPSRRELLGSSLALPLLSLPPAWRLVEEDDPGGPEPSARVAAFERMAFGMFVHWGLYSQLAAGEWAMNNQGIPKGRYMQLMRTFTATEFSGAELARVARSAGMRYITLTSRHHDGFSLYDTRGLSTLDVTHTPAGRDLVLDFVEGCRAADIVPMLYCTTLDWSDERFGSDWDGYQQYLRDSVRLLCSEYGEIGGFWFDGNWSRPDADWQLDQLYGLIRELQPQALILNNTGIHAGGVLGHPEIDSVTFERGSAHPIDRAALGKYVTGEMCHTFNFHWGRADKDFNYLSPAHVIEELCRTRGAGANLLFNVGPLASGKVPDYERAALARVGEWLLLHGGQRGPIYEGRTLGIEGPERDFGLLGDRDELFLFCFDLTATADSRIGVPARGPGERRFVGVPEGYERASWVDDGSNAACRREGDALVLEAAAYPYGTNTVVRVARVLRG